MKIISNQYALASINSVFLKGLVLTILCAVSVTSYADNSFGRLFTSPAERSELNYLRQTTKMPIAGEAEEPEQLEFVIPIPAEVPNAVSMQGYVKRSDGKKGTVWVNGQPLQESSSNKQVQVGRLRDKSNQVKLKIKANGQHLRLKAGQVYDSESNTVGEPTSRAIKAKIGTTGDAITP